MGKNDNLKRLVTFMAYSLSHKIGSMVNEGSLYKSKYIKESQEFMRKSKKLSLKENWNEYDKVEIKNMLKKNLMYELVKKDFLDHRKFDLVDEEIEKALLELGLN